MPFVSVGARRSSGSEGKHTPSAHLSGPRHIAVLTAATVGLAAALFAVYGLGRSGYVGYDTLFGLIWGRDIARLEVPDFLAPFAPTPHPLLNIVGAVLSPLGSDARGAMELFGLGATALLGVAAFRLGRAVATPAVGVLFALLLLTRPGPDPARALQRPRHPLPGLRADGSSTRGGAPVRRGMSVMALLIAAGLLRPEAWILAVAYAIYAGWAARPRRRVALLIAAAVAPVAVDSDGPVGHGRPLSSLTGAREAASSRGLPQGVDSALSAVPDFSQQLLGLPILVGAAVGIVFATWQVRGQLAPPAALSMLAIVPFLAYGLGGSAFFPRYLLPTAAVLTLLCAMLAVAGWKPSFLAAVAGASPGSWPGARWLLCFWPPRPHASTTSRR